MDIRYIRYIRWKGTLVHIAGAGAPVVYPHRYGRFKRTLCGKEYEIDVEVVRNEAYAQAHLCRVCAKMIQNDSESK
jgi:inorganic pyrophosphatase